MATTTTTAATATAAATSVTTYSALGSAINAGLSSLAAQASVALVNNGGDVGKTLEQLGSEQSIMNILIAMGVGATDTHTSEWGTTRVQSSGNTVVTDWAQRAQGYGVNTLVKGALTGASNVQEWATIAGAGAAGEAYRYWVGRNADIRPGVDRPEGVQFQPVVNDGGSGLFRVPTVVADGAVREGKNIGLNNVCTSVVAVCHGTPISNALNTIPGFNAFATLHDTWCNWLYENGMWNTATNLGSMPPALLINYGSLLDQYYYINPPKR